MSWEVHHGDCIPHMLEDVDADTREQETLFKDLSRC